MRQFLPRPTYANVMATAAMFVALGGTSYAVTKLPKKSVGTEQLRDRAVTKSKLADGVVMAGPPGPRGPRGESGPAGPAGPAGAAGPAGGVAQAQEWQPLGLEAPWANYGGGYALASYRKDASGTVDLRGFIYNTNGNATGSRIAVLPVGYRPASIETFNADAAAADGKPTATRINVHPSGAVDWWNGAVGSPYHTSLSGISFTPAR